MRLLFLSIPLLFCIGTANAAIFTPSNDAVPQTSGDLFTWSEGAIGSTFSQWSSFGVPEAGFGPDTVAAGPNVSAAQSAAGQAPSFGTPGTLTHNSIGFITGGGNAYGAIFPDPANPLGNLAATITMPGETTGMGGSPGNAARVIAQMRMVGVLRNDAFQLSVGGSQFAPDQILVLPDGQGAGGGFTSARNHYVAWWDLDQASSSYEISFAAPAHHQSLDELRVDTFTQASSFASVSAVPEPTSLVALTLVVGTTLARRRRRRRA